MSGGLNYDIGDVRKSVGNLYKKNTYAIHYKQGIYFCLSTEDNMAKEMTIDRQYWGVTYIVIIYALLVGKFLHPKILYV